MSELQRKSQLYDILPNLIFLAASNKSELWTDIEVVTLKQHAKDQATLKASDSDYKTLEELDALIDNLYNEEFKNTKEFIEVNADKIVVGLNCDQIDDTSIDKAILKLSELKSFEVGMITYL